MATAEENLKTQFQILQEQQQKKLMRRKQRKEERERAHTASVISTSSNAFGVTDNLDLKLAAPVPATNSHLSDELVDHLNEKIRELKDENGRVYKLLSERDFELRQLKKKREEEKAALATTGGPVTNETAGTKIVELSKKVRELTAEVESEKSKVKQLTRKCYDYQQQINTTNAENKSIRASAISLTSLEEKQPEDPGEIKSLQEKVKSLEAKVTEFRNQNTSLKQELRVAQKVLTQEVGENVNIQSCLNTTSNWRGRAQQIISLQQKVEELRQELEKVTGTEKDGGSDSFGNNSARKRTALDRHREQLRKVEKEKKDALEKQAQEKSALEEDNTLLKQKLDASKIRNTVLSNELKGLKKQLQTLLEKGTHDDELIDALMKQQTQLRQMLDEATKAQHNSQIAQQTKLNELSAKQQHDVNVVEQLKQIVADKETKVKVLENEIQQLKLAHLQRVQQQGVNALFQPRHQLQQQQQQQQEQTGDIMLDSRPSTGGAGDVIQLEYTVNSVSPSESRMTDRQVSDMQTPVPVPVPVAPAAPSTVPPSSRGHSRAHSRSSRPPSAGRTAEKQAMSNLQYQCQEYRTVAQVAEVERDKLMELMKVLQSRLDETNVKLQENQNELVQQRRKNALLEKQLGKATLNSTGSSTSRRKSAMTASVTALPTIEDEGNATMLEEVRINLEIQKDENEALKAALQSTLRAKEEDLKVYSETIEETKKVFLQALRQYKQTVQGT